MIMISLENQLHLTHICSDFIWFWKWDHKSSVYLDASIHKNWHLPIDCSSERTIWPAFPMHQFVQPLHLLFSAQDFTHYKCISSETSLPIHPLDDFINVDTTWTVGSLSNITKTDFIINNFCHFNWLWYRSRSPVTYLQGDS